MSAKSKPFATVFVLWPGDVAAKDFRVTTVRLLSMLIGDRRENLRFDSYRSDGTTSFWHVASAKSGLVGFYADRDADMFSGEPSANTSATASPPTSTRSSERDRRIPSNARARYVIR